MWSPIVVEILEMSNNVGLSKLNFNLRNTFFGPVTEATTVVERQQVFSSKIVTDLSIGYQVAEPLNITIGANNLLDLYPDRAVDEFADGGSNRSDGRFDWSRRAQQFGIGGRFLFARVTYTLK